MISNICLSCGDDLDWPSGDGCANMTAHKNDNKPWENLVTDDLVERLLDWPYQGETMAHEAAARIEQLTADHNATLARFADALAREINLTAERDRLREALTVISQFLATTSGNANIHSIWKMTERAREALKGGDAILALINKPAVQPDDDLVGHMTKLIAAGLDRIEQLTGEVQRWQGMFDEKHNLMLEHKARAKTAEAENARLREAGEKAICHITGYGEASTARIELRAALNGESHE